MKIKPKTHTRPHSASDYSKYSCTMPKTTQIVQNLVKKKQIEDQRVG